MMRGRGCSRSTVLALVALQQCYYWGAAASPLDPDEAGLLKTRERAVFCIPVEAERQGGDVTEFHSHRALADGKELQHYGQVKGPARETSSPHKPLLIRQEQPEINPD